MQSNNSSDRIGKRCEVGGLEIWVTPHEKRLLSVPTEMDDKGSHHVGVTFEKVQKLPEDWVYDNIKDAIYHCRRIYYIYMGILCYTLITILTTPTLDFFKEQIIIMPFMNAKMPLNYYLVLAPLLLIGFFIYKQLYLFKTNKLIKYAVDECKLINKGNCVECRDQSKECTLNMMCKHHLSRLYPWIIIYCQLVENKPNAKAEKERLNTLVGKFQQTFVSFSLWWVLPIMLLLLSMFVIKKHSQPLSVYMSAITCLGLAVVTFFWYYHQKIMRRTESIPFITRMLFVAATICIVLVPIMLNGLAFSGKLPWGEYHWIEENESEMLLLGAMESLPATMPLEKSSRMLTSAIRYFVFADLSRQTFAEKPKTDKAIWVYMDGRHFEGANLSKAFLKKASLKGSYLNYAFLEKANLEGAYLDKSHANGADFADATMNNVSCRKTKFAGTKFYDTKLNQAQFIGATLVNSEFIGAELSGALIVNSDVQNASFQYADLSGASFINSNLQKADFRSANLKGIICEPYNQFSDVKTLYNAQLDPELETILKGSYPHLFVKPQD